MAKKQEINPNVLLAVGAIAIAYFGVFKPLFEKLGLKESKEGKAIKELESRDNKNNPFSPVFLRNLKAGTKISLLKLEAKNNLAKRIYNAMGYFSDDEAAIISVFRTLKTQSQVADLSQYFNSIYKTDLLDFLKRGKGYFPQSGLNESELTQIIKIVDSLPKLIAK